MNLLSYDSFKKFDSATALSIIDAANARRPSSTQAISADELNTLLTPFDMKRLESYAESMIDYHVVLDLIPSIASLFFSRRLGPDCTLSAAQQAILLALGLQRKPVEALERELGIGPTQTLALFGKILRRITKHLQDIQKAGLGKDIPLEQPAMPQTNGQDGWKAVEETAEEELAQDVDDEAKRARAVQRELLDSMDMSQCVIRHRGSCSITADQFRYAIDGSADFSTAETQVKTLASAPADVRSRLSTTVSVKTKPGGEISVEKGQKGEKGEKVKEKRRRSEPSSGGGKGQKKTRS